MGSDSRTLNSGVVSVMERDASSRSYLTACAITILRRMAKADSRLNTLVKLLQGKILSGRSFPLTWIRSSYVAGVFMLQPSCGACRG